MSAYDAQRIFEEALQHADARHNPAMWALLSGLAKLAEGAQRTANDVKVLKRKLDAVEKEMRRLKR